MFRFMHPETKQSILYMDAVWTRNSTNKWAGLVRLLRHPEGFTVYAVATSATRPLMEQASDRAGLGTAAWRTRTP